MFDTLDEAYSYLHKDYLDQDEWQDNSDPLQALIKLKGNREYQRIAVYGVGPGIPLQIGTAMALSELL